MKCILILELELRLDLRIQKHPVILLKRERQHLTLLKSIHVQISTLTSSDVLQDMRVNVSEEGSENVIWYKVKTHD